MSRFERKPLSTSFAVLTLILTVSAISFGKGHVDSRFANIKIKNFGQMDERFYRGAQPKEQDYKDLAGLGIKTVIDLRDDPESYEKREVEALGMRYINIPMSDTTYPERAQVDQFLKLIDDPASGKLYVHCAGGRHRTGVVGAVYRFNHDRWNYDQVYAEMKNYDFYTRWGHGAMKQFVQDYWQQLSKQSGAASSATAGVSH
ncbi:MAG TPA: tyrosine-protein phosphatase [Nitrososphaera sp.]|nr:tyrosine-protein phosphatase [Nitrososphaera sp.]